MMRVIFSDASRIDLRSITVFIASDSPTRARSFVAELAGACSSLADKPFRYPLIPDYEAKGLRRRPLGNYAIIYTVGTDAVTIARVLHTAMDLNAALGGN
jgi:toxin ParE1/3/4